MHAACPCVARISCKSPVIEPSRRITIAASHRHVIAQAGEVGHDPLVLAGHEIEIGVGHRLS